MNLYEYKNSKSLEYGKIAKDDARFQYTRDFSFRHGFDHALSLDLPIKFAEFIDNPMSMEAKEIVRKNFPNHMKPLYEWWLENIFKL